MKIIPYIIRNTTHIIGVFVVLSLFVSQISIVQAQQFSFSLKPAQNHVIAKPGASIVLPYTLVNTGDPTVVKLQPYLLSVKDSGGSYDLVPYYSDVPDFPVFTTSDAALRIGEPFLISAQEAIEFDLIVVTNENLKEEDYYFTFVVESEPTEGFEDTSHISLQSGIGSNIYLSISKDGNLSSSGEITQFSVQPQFTFSLGNRQLALFDSFQPVPILVTVANKGKRILQTSGTLSVQSNLSTGATVIPIPEQYILADSQRLLSGTSTENNLISNTNTAIVSGSFIGSYTVRADLQIGNDAEQQNVSVRYYVFPFRYSAYVLILFVMLLATPRILRLLRK
ncbi:hypothetical protein IPM65_03455 [Candidatus Roizmanbacteria bacterium]|nr:MAG: hypothetical protein IPM65_03455 [Candidatus Roizmanbacteria bacterium]